MGSVIPVGSVFTPPNFLATNLLLLIADGGLVLLVGGNARRIRARKSSSVPDHDCCADPNRAVCRCWVVC